MCKQACHAAHLHEGCSQKVGYLHKNEFLTFCTGFVAFFFGYNKNKKTKTKKKAFAALPSCNESSMRLANLGGRRCWSDDPYTLGFVVLLSSLATIYLFSILDRSASVYFLAEISSMSSVQRRSTVAIVH